MQYFGTLEYIEKLETRTRTHYVKGDPKNGILSSWVDEPYQEKVGRWRIKGPQAALQLGRIVPYSWHPEAGVIEVQDSLKVYEDIVWLMTRYQLKILPSAFEKWNERKSQYKQLVQRREVNQTGLTYAEPTKAFLGELKNFQKIALDFFLKNDGVGLLADQMGLGKAEFIENRVFTPNGRKQFKELKIGDRIIGSDGKPTEVVGVFPQGKKKLYRVGFNDGCSILVGGEHLWKVASRNEGRWIVLSTEQMLDTKIEIALNGRDWNAKRPYKIKTYFKEPNGNNKWQIPLLSSPIEFMPTHPPPIDPYFLGVLLGDGSLGINLSLEVHKDDFEELLSGAIFTERLPIANKRKAGFGKLLRSELKGLELDGKYSKQKFVPDIYKYGSLETRLAILQGLMDTDGHCMSSKQKKGFQGTEFCSVSNRLASDLCEIVESLGGIARLKTKEKTSYTYKGKKLFGQRAYRVNVKLPAGMNPFRLKRKADLYKAPQKYHVARYISDIKYECEADAICIAVNSADQLYVTEHAIVTHNTVSSLAYIATAQSTFPVLVVARLSTLIQWGREIERFVAVNGKYTPRIIMIREGKPSALDAADFYIINYDLLAKRKDDLIDAKIKTIISDECQDLRNWNIQRYEAMTEIASSPSVVHRIGLSGSPMYNRGLDLWSIVDFLNPGIMGTRKEFIDMYCDESSGSVEPSKRDALSQFLTQNIMLRRITSQVDAELTDLFNQKRVIPVDMEFYQSKMETLMEELKLKLKDSKTDLKRITLAYQNFNATERQVAGMAKLKFVEDFVSGMTEADNYLIVFCHHRMFHETLRADFLEYKPSSIIGGQTDQERQENIDKFQNGETKLMIASLRAGSVGINLTRANFVLHAELDWSPAIHQQAIARAYRIGQKNDVFSFYLVGEDTIDEIIADVLVEKKLEIDQILGDIKNEKQIDEVHAKARTMRILEILETKFAMNKKPTPVPLLPS